MKQNHILQRIVRIVTVPLLVILLVAVTFLMKHVEDLLRSDVQINLTEVVTQNKDVITSKLNLEVNNLELTANRLSDRIGKEGTTDPSLRLVQVFDDYLSVTEPDGIFITTPDGIAHMGGGVTATVAGRNYFRLASKGIQNISDRLVSRVDGEEVFVISVPVLHQGEIVGTVQRIYSPEAMYDLCSVSLFSDQGEMYVVNSGGYILISSRSEAYSQEADNYYRMLFSKGNEQASRQLQQDIQAERSGFMETTINGQKYFSAYTPVETIHDWFLISTIANDAVSPNGNIVIRMFYGILFGVVLVFAIALLLFFAYQTKQRKALQKIAFVDSVTGGDTFNKFRVDLALALSSGEQAIWLLAMDIENFKYVNSFYGFDYGDRLLKRVYAILSGKLDAGEQVARISGDHFIALLYDARAERLTEMLSDIRTEDGMAVYCAAGVYQVTDRGESVNLMVDKASTASREAKESPFKKIQLYSERSDRQMIRNEQMKRAVDFALANGEIVPYFQPKVHIDTGELMGAEALARWKKPDGTLVPPDVFIPVCEKTGQVIEVDLCIFEQTLRFLRRNLDAGVRCVPISVNFSQLHLSGNDFLQQIDRLLHAYNVPPSLIEIELTESVFFDNYAIMHELIERLHGIGLLIDMDDFGTGYSSLNMLMDIPIDVLKIDRAFLKATRSPEKQRAILSAIVQMAESLQIKVVVEGVETEKNVELMRSFGCTIAQGYYFARPMPEEELQPLFEEGHL